MIVLKTTVSVSVKRMGEPVSVSNKNSLTKRMVSETGSEPKPGFYSTNTP